MEIKGNTALVTGAASGLGEATVRLLLKAGANIVAMDVNEARGKTIVSEFPEKTVFVKTDVTNEADVRQAIELGKKAFGGIHFCVNCAGTGLAKRTVARTGAHELAPFEWLIKLNLIGTFNVASKAAFEMSLNTPNKNGERGVIINVASIAAFDGQIGQAAYSASKGGVVGMTLPMARDLSGLGIRVVAIAPGLFETPLMSLLPEEHRKALNDSVPFPKRLGLPQEFAMLVEHIIRNPYINGETIRLDGALRMAPK